jgi:pyruvate/2-oxoglutarate dehydrogenase complex dihydrolipoamide dehydrogenase (E3) component
MNAKSPALLTVRNRAKMPISAIPRAKTLGETRGLLKAVVDSKTNKILGFTILSVDAGEMIGTIQMTMLAALPYTALQDAVLSHPTMIEGFYNLFLTLSSKPA